MLSSISAPRHFLLLATVAGLAACEAPAPRETSDVPVDTLHSGSAHVLPADSAAPLLRALQPPESFVVPPDSSAAPSALDVLETPASLHDGLPAFDGANDTLVGRAHYAGMLDDGRLVFLSAERVNRQANSPARGRRTLFVLQPATGAVDSLATLDAGLWRIDAGNVTPFEFGAPPVAAARGNRIVIPDGSGFALVALSPAGEQVTRMEVSVPAAPVTPILRTAHEHALGDSAASPRPRRSYPQWLPALRSVVLTQSDEVWAEHYRPDVDLRGRAWAVFNRDGELVQWVSVAAGARIVDATTSHIFVAVDAPDGVRVTAHDR